APADIGGIWLGHFNAGMVEDGFAASLALNAHDDLRWAPATRVENACASGAAAIRSAMDAIKSGRVRAALVIGAEKMTHLATADVSACLGRAAYQPEEAGQSFPAIFAHFAQAYAARFGDPTEAMALIAAKNHANAMANPLAQMHKPLSVEFCREVSEKNPMIAAPLKVSDCSLVSDGAAALVLVADDLAQGQPAVRIAAMEQVNDLLPMSRRDISVMEGPRRAIHAALARAGTDLDGLDFAEVHDCFTIAELMIYEAMGLAAPGQGGRVLQDGTVMRGGALPVNLSGGLKAKGHPVGATGVSMHVLGARQILGQAGDMQLPGARRGLVFNMGGAAVANYASVLEGVA
ncbi:MAG: thiolase domain-containing protein, partial [Rhodobacteraceae bacterium]|nr:thiolase domain-containing protein [Paracoccaceae bacterium]